MAVGKFQVAVKKRQAAAIRGHERELVLLEGKKDPVEHIAGLINRDGIRGPAQPIPELGLPNGISLRILEGRKGRELLLREAENLKKARAAAQRGDVLRVGLDVISEAGSSRTMAERRRAGNVVAPAFSTWAKISERTATSRSVVVRRRPVLVVSRRALVRTGSVERVLTTSGCVADRRGGLLW